MTTKFVGLMLAAGLLLTLATGCVDKSQPPPSGAPGSKQGDQAHPDVDHSGDAGGDHK